MNFRGYFLSFERENIRIYHEFLDMIDNLSRGSLLGITGLCRANSDPRDNFVYPIHKRMLDSFSCIL